MMYCYFDARGVCKMFSDKPISCELIEKKMDFTDEEESILTSGGSVRLCESKAKVCLPPKMEKKNKREEQKRKIHACKTHEELKNVLLEVLDMI